MGAYLRKMALDGYCINLDLQDVKELVSLLRRCSNNLNQYAKRANETGNIYESDIRDLQERLEEIWTDMKEVLVCLSSFIFQNSIMKIRKGCVSMRFLKFVGKMVLKLVALPVLFVLGLICLLAKLVVNVSSFAIGALILYILGCCIYCVFQSLWLQLGLLVGIGLAVYAVLFLFVLFQEIGEHIKENLRDFIFS